MPSVRFQSYCGRPHLQTLLNYNNLLKDRNGSFQFSFGTGKLKGMSNRLVSNGVNTAMRLIIVLPRLNVEQSGADAMLRKPENGWKSRPSSDSTRIEEATRILRAKPSFLCLRSASCVGPGGIVNQALRRLVILVMYPVSLFTALGTAASNPFDP